MKRAIMEAERGENESLTREYVFLTAVVFVYELVEWWALFVGPGYELKSREFFVTRIGTDFIKRFEEGWSIALTMMLDIKEVNNTSGLGVSLSKAFGKTN